MTELLLKKYIPMTESTYYTLLSLKEIRHGYAIIQYISELTQGRIQMGTGTLYTMLGRLVEDGLIRIIMQENNKKTYEITEDGNEILRCELNRLRCQLRNGEEVYGQEI